MQLAVLKNTWEMTGSLRAKITKIREAGYDGIETAAPANRAEAAEMRELLDAHGLVYVGMHFCDDARDLEAGMHLAVSAGAARVTVHAGRDSMSFSEGCDYFKTALEAEARSGARAAYETHRGRLLYTPWTTAAYLTEFPELEICADFSHWVTVCERVPLDCKASLDLAIARTAHIHSRVGHTQGPQVPDPAAPECWELVDQYFLWWQAMADAAQARGEALFTIDPEFGPPPYLATLPYTQQPVSDLWEVILAFSQQLRTRLKVR